MKTPKVRILTCTRATKQADGVLWYGTALSRTRGTRVVHGLVARKHGRRLRIDCSCESGLQRRTCDHAPAFARRIARAKKISARRRAA